MLTPESGLTIRLVRDSDADVLWPILRDVVRAGDTYAIEPGLSRERLLDYWCEAPRATYVAEAGGEILGTYYIKTNQAGGGAHVCNCGYITAPAARGRGVARALCLHSQDVARDLGYLAMQFNFVVATNQGALRLWASLGYETVGRLPWAFLHPVAGYVDAFVLYKWLGASV
ncbi:GNAT family N-acetyltransferase [Roseovarius aestuariivivens]|uniref:GNAT family N-acetyltransferase n=1 Tax=Roseovarius aestuariivivens TaxID=1888910 RepID=UPI0010819163|nr:GNAT family N-acetyltransferase [Roseovarius aestuariivivens]